MDDFDYLVEDSNAAWLDGRDDGRFAHYERYYQQSRARAGKSFDLEKANEDYAQWARDQPSRMLRLVSRPLVGRAIVATFALYMGSQAVPLFASKAPWQTAGVLLAAFVALRVFHRQRRRAR